MKNHFLYYVQTKNNLIHWMKKLKLFPPFFSQQFVINFKKVRSEDADTKNDQFELKIQKTTVSV